jgi:dolichol kinase
VQEKVLGKISLFNLWFQLPPFRQTLPVKPRSANFLQNNPIAFLFMGAHSFLAAVRMLNVFVFFTYVLTRTTFFPPINTENENFAKNLHIFMKKK